MNLEDKILGEKAQYYCSSSEDEDANEPVVCRDEATAPTLQNNMSHFTNNSTNTGPKGVIKDWQRFKQLETEKRQNQELERLELMKKLSITSKTAEEDKKQKEQEEMDAELEELMNEESLLEFQKKRMLEMFEMSGNIRKFGTVIALTTGDEFLQAIDAENKNVTIIIHIYEEKYRACRTMNTCLNKLAADYPCVKFCKILSNATNLSKNFKTNALPTLLIYKNGQIIGNFIRLSDELGDDFFASDIENFLIEHSLLTDKTFNVFASKVNNEQCNTYDDDDDE
ncbi:hypothetical protein PVAND_011462 [Polypedilum vanderplanki]|uniref:Phosducin domain-containing protein n=1 Tax=Polypedilum vanderplanki TaxID=319348 RepID=A0A9J6CJJ3_POLVA|nr:hypothetical protein PVAND_011462 [Polypedilum vanderplanki]